MEGVAMNSHPSVLIVDRSEETREVLQTALERRGVKILSAGRAASGIRLAQEHQPDLIVLDLETDDASDCLTKNWESLGSEKSTQNANSAQPHPYQPRLVLLGKMRGCGCSVPGGEFVSKPYHFGPLIRKIEEMLSQ
jgi:DNA-binding NarL/FixJ family response regulator